MKIGIFGGSYDPIHKGHIALAKNAYEQFHLDEIWMMPSGLSPHKNSKKMLSAKERYMLCEIAAKEYPYIKVSSFEIDDPKVCYTYRTMEKLKEIYPEHEFFLMMGADSLASFSHWVNPSRITKCANLLVMKRNQVDDEQIKEIANNVMQDFDCKVYLLNTPDYPYSSTAIRTALKNKEKPDGLDENVYQYILDKHFYENED